MKQRTFLTPLALFLFFFNFGIFIISVAMYKDAVKHAEEKSLGEHYFIVSGLIKDFHAMESRGINIEGSTIFPLIKRLDLSFIETIRLFIQIRTHLNCSVIYWIRQKMEPVWQWYRK